MMFTQLLLAYFGGVLTGVALVVWWAMSAEDEG